MELSLTSTPVPRPFRLRIGAVLAVVALGIYAVLLSRHMGACAGGSDQSGYFNHARLLGARHLHVVPRTLPGFKPSPTEIYLYVPLGFKPAPNGDGMVPTYPAGLPLLILAAASVTGWEYAGDAVLGLHAILGVILIYALGCALGLSRRWAVIGAVILAASPLYLFMSIQTMSDVPALVWTTAAVLAAWNSRGRTGWAAAAGFAFGAAILIRPNNVLALAPVAIALGASPRRWLLLALGGLPAGIFFCAHTWSAYGSLLTTGYGNTHTLFDAHLAGQTLRHYVIWLPRLFTPVVVFALGLPWAAQTAPRPAALLGAWAVAYLAFFAVYFNTHETWWYLRFILPAAPALIVGGLLAARALTGRWTARAPHLVWAAALAGALINGHRWTRDLDAWLIGPGELKYERTTEWLKAHVPDNAVLAVMEMSGAVFYYTPSTLIRYDQIERGDFDRVAAAVKAEGRPIYAVLFPFEAVPALGEHMPGRWTRAGAVDDVKIWRWEGP